MNRHRAYPNIMLQNDLRRMGDRRFTHASTDEYIEAWNGTYRYHRNGGPAVVKPNGIAFWYDHGKLHREDGPAVVKPNGKHEFWFCGRYKTLEEWCDMGGLSETEKAYYLLKYQP